MAAAVRVAALGRRVRKDERSEPEVICIYGFYLISILVR